MPLGYTRAEPTYRLADALPLGCMFTGIVQNVNPTTCLYADQLLQLILNSSLCCNTMTDVLLEPRVQSDLGLCQV